MPDPNLSEAIREAYASAPAEDVILHTIELRHPAFVDADGNPSAARIVHDTKPLQARLEATAPLDGGQMVWWVPIPFDFTLAPVENAPVPEMEVTVDNIGQALTKYLDMAVTDATPVRCTYRPYLASDLERPQMDPPLTFTLTNIKASTFSVSARARLGIDLNRAFPFKLYTSTEYPGLIGR